MDVNLNEIKNKRIAAFDYGLKRVGYAVSDELHIIASPRCVFDRTKDNFWDLVTDSIKKEKCRFDYCWSSVSLGWRANGCNKSN